MDLDNPILGIWGMEQSPRKMNSVQTEMVICSTMYKTRKLETTQLSDCKKVKQMMPRDSIV